MTGRRWVMVGGLLCGVLSAAGCSKDEERAPLILPDPNYVEHPVCEARASAYYPDGGCLGPQQFFGRGEVFGVVCPVADASVCVTFAADAGTPLGQRVWVFSGEHYGLPDNRLVFSCDPETKAAAVSAPSCAAP